MTRHSLTLLPTVGLAVVAAIASGQQAEPKLKITDKAGTEVTITAVDLDYSNYPGSFGTYTPDHERQGIRVRQGQATVTVPWRNVASLKLDAEPLFFVQKECSGPEQQSAVAT